MRQKRLELFSELVQQVGGESVSVLDVGGTGEFWRHAPPELVGRCSITIANCASEAGVTGKDFNFVVADARDLSCFASRQFDLCLSNSVIEHVGTLYDQRSMASEIRRVGNGYFVQTPNRTFPIEPHFLVPLWPHWPIRVRAKVYQHFNLGWMGKQEDPFLARAEVEQIRLLDERTMGWLFPEAKIVRERFAGLTKSIIALRQPT
jgi:hypothetical protein